MPSTDIKKKYKHDPWEKQPDEPRKKFELFSIYRDIGPDDMAERPLLEAYQIWKDEPETTRLPQKVRRWSKEWDWEKRKAAFYERIDYIAQQSSSYNLKRAKERQAKIAAEFSKVILEYFERFNQLPWEKKVKKIEELDMKEMMQAVAEAQNIENRALGEKDDGPSGKDVFDALVEAFDQAHEDDTIEADYEIIEEDEEDEQAGHNDGEGSDRADR